MSERVIDVAARAAMDAWIMRIPSKDMDCPWEDMTDAGRSTWRSAVLAVAEVLDREIDPPEYVGMSEILEREARSQPE